MSEKNYFKILNEIDVNNHTEKKGKLTYLSWTWAWAELKKKHPKATHKVYENDLGWNYHTDGKYAWVKTGVTVEDIEHIEYLPVLDYKNKSIPVDNITSFNVNNTIQRSVTKAIARHGLGLYVYAGEDLPDIPVWDDEKQKDKYIKGFTECADDDVGLVELWNELCDATPEIREKRKNQVWSKISPEVQKRIKEALE